MTIMSLGSRSYVNAYIVLMKVDTFCVYNYIISLLNIILVLFYRSGQGINPLTITSVYEN